MNQQIVDALNGLIATELVAVNQYFMHAKLCEHWGFERMAAHLRGRPRLAAGILVLAGVVVLLGPLVGLAAQGLQYQGASKLESGYLQALNEMIATGQSAADLMLNKGVPICLGANPKTAYSNIKCVS